MTVAAQQIVEQFKMLPDADKREVAATIAQEIKVQPFSDVSVRRKTVADIAGKFRSSQTDANAELDESFVKAILESKGR